jgi:hypothetical protein
MSTTPLHAPISRSVQSLRESALSHGFLGGAIEIRIATRVYRKTMEGLVQLGIGPWRVYTFTPDTVSEQTYRSEPASFSIKVSFAQQPNGIIWETMQPLEGPSNFEELVQRRNKSTACMHHFHIEFDCNHKQWEDRIADFESRRFSLIRSEKRMGFPFFDTEAATGGTKYFPPGFEYPEPKEWNPEPPPSVETKNRSNTKALLLVGLIYPGPMRKELLNFHKHVLSWQAGLALPRDTFIFSLSTPSHHAGVVTQRLSHTQRTSSNRGDEPAHPVQCQRTRRRRW